MRTTLSSWWAILLTLGGYNIYVGGFVFTIVRRNLDVGRGSRQFVGELLRGRFTQLAVPSAWVCTRPAGVQQTHIFEIKVSGEVVEDM